MVLDELHVDMLVTDGDRLLGTVLVVVNVVSLSCGPMDRCLGTGLFMERLASRSLAPIGYRTNLAAT